MEHERLRRLVLVAGKTTLELEGEDIQLGSPVLQKLIAQVLLNPQQAEVDALTAATTKHADDLAAVVSANSGAPK